jgi:hypothetical protein
VFFRFLRWSGVRDEQVALTVNCFLNNGLLVQSIYGAIQEYGGFERPAWLD